MTTFYEAVNFGISPVGASTPEVLAGDYFTFKGGTISALFNGSYLTSDYDTGNDAGNSGPVSGSPLNKPAPIIALFDYFRYRDDDLDDSVWTATIPVYKDSVDGSCDNVNKDRKIVGFAKIVVKTVEFKLVEVDIDCNLLVIEGRGGGGTYGNLKGTIPNLVK